MATVYTQTSLKKIKKDELIQMFLDQQAKLNDIKMDEVVEKLKEENEKLKKDLEDNEYTRKYENSQWQKTCEKQDEQIWQLTEEVHSRMNKEQEKELEKENEALKEENKDLQTQVDHLVKKKYNEAKFARQNSKLQIEIENLKGEVKFWTFKAEEFERKYIQTDENYKLHRKSADIYEKKLIEEIEILRKKQICDICGNAPAGY